MYPCSRSYNKTDFQQALGFTEEASATEARYNSIKKHEDKWENVRMVGCAFLIVGVLSIITLCVWEPAARYADLACEAVNLVGGTVGLTGLITICTGLLLSTTGLNIDDRKEIESKISPDWIYDHPHGSKPITSPNGEPIGRSVRLMRKGFKTIFQTYEYFEMQELGS